MKKPNIELPSGVYRFTVNTEFSGLRLDQYLAETVPHIRGGDCLCMGAGDGGCGPTGNGKGTK